MKPKIVDSFQQTRVKERKKVRKKKTFKSSNVFIYCVSIQRELWIIWRVIATDFTALREKSLKKRKLPID